MMRAGSTTAVHLRVARVALICVALVLVLFPGGNTTARAAQPPNLPDWSKVVRTVRDYFAAIEQPAHEIISRDQTLALLDRLTALGFKSPDRAQILEQIPTEEDFLVVELRTRNGRAFMEDIAEYPHAYDRLDRLSRLPRGKQMVRDLIRGPDGYKLIEYMTTAAGGRELGRQLSRTPKGKKFNEPTGRIYTQAMLLKRLKQSYDALAHPAPAKRRRSQ